MTYSFESIAQLDHSKDFSRLHQKFNQFNPFKVLRVDQFEIRHSNVLAWLLDPNENHQLGSLFIKKIITRLVTKTENEDKAATVDFASYLYASFTDAEVYREVKTKNNRFIDLLVVVPSQKLVFLIENKFHATESKGQLRDYLDYAQECYPDYSIIPVFLTLSSDTPSETEYWVLDYHDILEILSLHLELNGEAISDNIADFIRYYIAILEEELVEDEEAIQRALHVYQFNQAAIDLLYLSQHEDYRKYPRYQTLYEQSAGMSFSERIALKRIYEKRKQTIDFIFKVGSNVLREAFLTFVKNEEIPEEVYNAHVRLPSFILPDWNDFKEIIGEPEQGYWLGHGLIMWFERKSDDRLKLYLEVGPIPYEKRVRFLRELEKQQIHIRESAKLEGRKYTRIYTQYTTVSDWANKDEIVKSMEGLYHDPALNEVFKKIALAVEAMGKELEELDRQERAVQPVHPSSGTISKGAFVRFAENHDITEDHFQIGNRNASFLLPVFRELEQIYGAAREKWWWHNSTFTYWFERLRDDRLKLTLELGPLEPEKRQDIIQKLEEAGIAFSANSKLLTAKYTRLFSKAKVIRDWENGVEVSQEMEALFNDMKNQEIIRMIENLV